MTTEQKQDLDNELAPATNPDTGKPAVTGRKKKKTAKTATHVKGADLVPNLTKRSTAAGTLRRYHYWVGITPSCPVEGLYIAGINFPKVNERLVDDPMRSGNKKRVPVIGAIVWLTEQKIELLRDRLPRTVIRFTDDKGEHEEPGTGQNIGDNARRPRRGHAITIPTPDEIKHREVRGKPTRAYAPDTKRDAPAARFMFAQLCEDQDNPRRGEFYPEPLETTGLDWPDKMAELDDLLS
jgi:hypothetical protein